MANQTVTIDIYDWELALSKFTMSEAALLATINSTLQRNGSDLACRVVALRHVENPIRNWAVAQLDLPSSSVQNRQARIKKISAIILSAAHDYDVEWPSMQLH